MYFNVKINILTLLNKHFEKFILQINKTHSTFYGFCNHIFSSKKSRVYLLSYICKKKFHR